MAHQGSEQEEEAITKEEIHGEEPPPKTQSRNAFAELMAPKRKTPPSTSSTRPARSGNPFKDRMGLGAYLEDPASYPSSRVIYHNDDFVAIHDRYPKATIHTLLLPRSSKYNLLHPFEALDDPEFLASVKAETQRLKALVAKELQRRLGAHSQSDAQRQAVLDGDAEPDKSGELPKGRDWAAEVKAGVHAVPSMRHLHVHVLSRDMYSEALRHRKHYNSFNTPFLVDLDDFPLAADDARRDTKEEAYLRWDMKCWRCDQNFKNQFQKLKGHLAEEYETWKKL
ncbi:aprataxin-like protein [Fusarium torreyae]|uniref:Aprataxin-like protein n=1 Tax=Fusarium torreyae TaxID=1237075 RepID=A0A9W8VBV8_9HYPO|nr:aprataxin-like protein [Fusarium torreyae]